MAILVPVPSIVVAALSAYLVQTSSSQGVVVPEHQLMVFAQAYSVPHLLPKHFCGLSQSLWRPGQSELLEQAHPV